MHGSGRRCESTKCSNSRWKMPKTENKQCLSNEGGKNKELWLVSLGSKQ